MTGACRHADDRKRRMALRVEQLALQGHEPPPQNVGLRGVELLSQTLEPVLLIRGEVHLDGLANPTGATAFMIVGHDS